MTITELVERVAKKIGAPPDFTWAFADEIIRALILALDAGEEVKIRGLGRFHWAPVKGRKAGLGEQKHYPGGLKLKFAPAGRFRTRRHNMDKLGVVLDPNKVKEADEKVKEAQKKKPGGKSESRCCPVCLAELDDAGACPVHGTEPFEPGGQGD
jgi:nucleoid DNA-binding protein